MALRGTLTHRKTRRLATALGMPPCCALGVVEALWHVTAEQCPCGDIGRMTNRDIADEIFFDGDPDKLVAALVESGFIDECKRHRLLIHDWKHHADQATKRKVGRMGETIIEGPCNAEVTVSHNGVMSSHDESRLAMTGPPVPVPVPEPVPPYPPEGEVRKPRKQFQKPTIDEIAAYCEQRRNGVAPQKFFDFYESKGWKVGKNAMVDWKAAVRNWEGNNGTRAPPSEHPVTAAADQNAEYLNKLFEGRQ